MSMMVFEFEELPLVIHNGIEAAVINGQAEIHYRADGCWHTVDITVEGFGGRDATGKRQWPQVPAPEAIAAIIVRRLENEWQSRVQDAVNEQIAADHERAADDHAEMRREQRLMD